MNTPQEAPEWTNNDITYIMTELAKADTTISPDDMKAINEGSDGWETHQDDSEITKEVQQRLQDATREEITKIKDLLIFLSEANIWERVQISIISELKVELAKNTKKSIQDIITWTHNDIIWTMTQSRRRYEATMEI